MWFYNYIISWRIFWIFRMIFLSWNPQTSYPLLAKSSQISLAGPSTSTSSSPFYPEQADRRHGFSQCPFLPLHTQVQVTTPPKCTGWRKNIDVVEVKFFSSLAELIYVEYLFIYMSKYVLRRIFWNLLSRFIKPSFAGDFYSKSYLDSPTPVMYCALIWRLLEIILIQKINK